MRFDNDLHGALLCCKRDVGIGSLHCIRLHLDGFARWGFCEAPCHPCPHMPAYARNTSPKDFILCVGVGSRRTAVVMGPGWCCPMHADIWRVHPRYKWYILNHTDTVNYCYSCFRNLLEAVNPRWLLTWSVLLNSIMQWEYGLLLFLPSRCIKPKARLGTKHCVKCDSWLF